MTKRKGFIFDLDGVIVDTAKYHFLAWQKLAHSIGVDFTKEQNEQLKGISRLKSLQKILDWGGIILPTKNFNALMSKKNKDYLQYIENMDTSEILVDVPRILKQLEIQNQGIALGSASKNAKIILEKVNLKQIFEAIIDGNDITKGKPDPEVFLKAATALSIKPEDCIVFEDSTAGVTATNTANMISIGIGEKSVLNKADYVFTDFTEITSDFIEKLINK